MPFVDFTGIRTGGSLGLSLVLALIECRRYGVVVPWCMYWLVSREERMSRLRLIAMVALVVVGLGLLVIGPMDDRSINWVNVVLAVACIAGAIYLRPRKTE